MKGIRGRLIKGVFAGLLALVLLTGCAAAVTGSNQQPTAPGVDSQAPAATYPVVQSPSSAPAVPLTSIADVVAKVKPSVVAISTEMTARDIFNRPVTQSAAGSGWIIGEDGYIVTNNHVVEDSTVVTVVLDDGQSFQAEKVYTDRLTDLAVIKIAASGLPVAETGNSSALRVGDGVVAIGNSLGMGISATSGIVSAAGVSLSESAGQTMLDLIQTDAAINPGNSGGPLVNMAGQVIGINSIKIATVGVEGMGYAISINQALPIIDSLIQQGRVVRPWLGVSLYTVDPLVASRYDLAVQEGVLVARIVPGSPAEDCGLQPGDVIVSFANEAIHNTQDFTTTIFKQQAGSEVEITYWRGEEKKVTSAVLEASPA